MNTEPSKIWPMWDDEINRFGEWMLVGSIACLGLPPIPGLLGIGCLLVTALKRSVRTAKVLFAERDALRKKESDGMLTIGERSRYDFLMGELRRSDRLRDVKIYWIGYIAFVASIVYLLVKFTHSPLSQLWSKGMWG